MDWTDIYRTFCQTRMYILSSANEIFSRRDHILGHKSSLAKPNQTEIIPYLLRPEKNKGKNQQEY